MEAIHGYGLEIGKQDSRKNSKDLQFNVVVNQLI